MIPDPFLEICHLLSINVISLYFTQLIVCLKICLEQDGRSQLICENKKGHTHWVTESSANGLKTISIWLWAICPLFLTLCFSFHLFLKQAGTHSWKFSLAPWVLHEFFCSEECLNMDLFSSSAEWLRLNLLDFSCVLQVISKHHSFWHSTCAQWRSTYFLFTLLRHVGETLLQDQWVNCLPWIPAAEAATEESWGLF